MFKGCKSLKEIQIPDGVEIIGEKAFEGCEQLESIVFPNNIQLLPNYVCRNCKSLKTVQLPCQLTTISGEVFKNCNQIKRIVLPGSLTFLSGGAFEGCTSIKELVLENGDEKCFFGYLNYSGLSIGQAAFAECPLEKVYLGKNISYNDEKGYGYSFLYNHDTIQDLIFGEKFDSFGNYFFADCDFLTDYTIPAQIRQVGNYAFMDCRNLESITISEGVNKLGDKAFNGCEKLVSVSAVQMPPLEITDETFDKTTYFNATLYVPTGTIEQYKQATGWKNFFNIQEKDFPCCKDSMIISPSDEYIFDMNGYRLSSPKKGMNIIRQNNGTTKKVIIK